MKLAEIIEKSQSLPAEEVPSFFENLVTLLFQFRYGVALRHPYRLLLDASILMRFESYGSKSPGPRLLSVLAFFNYLEHFSSFKGDVVITPAVFYEYSRKQGASNLNEHWAMKRNLESSVEEVLGLKPQFEGTETYETAAPCIDALQHDEQSIREYLRGLPETDWSGLLTYLGDESQQRLLKQSKEIVWSAGEQTSEQTWPISLAHGVYAEPELLYKRPALRHLSYGSGILFGATHFMTGIVYTGDISLGVSHFLTSHIAWKISESTREAHISWIDRTRESDEHYLFSKLLHLNKRNELKGLGDVELLSAGNVSQQFNIQKDGKYHPASIPLALDRNLNEAIRMMSGFGIESADLGGNQDPETRHTAIEMFVEHDEKQKEALERRDTCQQEQAAFTKELTNYFEE